jgi:hypothetical protein
VFHPLPNTPPPDVPPANVQLYEPGSVTVRVFFGWGVISNLGKLL